MVDNKVSISTESLAQAARDFAAAASVFDTARSNFYDRLGKDANPRPWSDDAIGAKFSSYYEPAEANTRKSLDDVVTGLYNLSDLFTRLSMTYQSVEDTNAS